ncbi:MAG: hypothetical protein ACR2QV_01345 [Gammaproteobacteria bacterium]
MITPFLARRAKHACVVSTLMIAAAVPGVQAMTLDDYLIVGKLVNDTALDVSNYELGRVSAAPGSAPAVTGVGVGPTISNDPTYDGNVAIVKTTGEVKLSDVNVYADRGVDCAGSYSVCSDSGSNFSNSDYDQAPGAPGLSAIGLGNGVSQNVDLSAVTGSLATAKSSILGYGPGDITGSISTSSGDINSDQTVFLNSGLNVLDFSGLSSGTDITVKANLIFQGAADAFAVVLVPDDSLFKTSQGNLLIGNGGIGLNNVVIVSLATGNDAHFDLSNTLINGVALWDIGADMGNMSLDNVSGCTQLVAGDVDIQNVRLSRCGFDATLVPVPAAAWLFGSALVGLIGWRRRFS